SRPRKDRGAYKGGRSCRRGDNIGLAADGAGRGWVPSKWTNLMEMVTVPHGVGSAGLGHVQKLTNLMAKVTVPHGVGQRGWVT
ncbi:hypothetical protein, partial [Fodinicola feengrottensis]|uniref:hypothetical protein n=1 Tax=Fodinicola feengrottensis TaxID=435914 RepID=UPI0031D9A465